MNVESNKKAATKNPVLQNDALLDLKGTFKDRKCK